MTPANDDVVSPRTEKALREAMKRLLDGNPKHTDGRLSKANLGREAGVSHATLFRAKTILSEWDDAVAALGERTHQQARHANETNSLRGSLAKKTDECAELRRRLEAAATVIATLHHENTALRAQLNRQGTVVAISHQRSTGMNT
jgi:chromosome segregation ATPase